MTTYPNDRVGRARRRSAKLARNGRRWWMLLIVAALLVPLPWFAPTNGTLLIVLALFGGTCFIAGSLYAYRTRELAADYPPPSEPLT